MNKKKDLPRGTLPVSVSANNELAAKIKELELENDILKQTIEILKKEKGIDLLRLKNREKTMIIDVLRDKYSLSQLIGKLRKESVCRSFWHSMTCQRARISTGPGEQQMTRTLD